MDIYVGNLRYTVNADELGELFADHGTVVSCEVVTDGGGRSRGYGYVVMSEAEGTAAIAAIDGTGFHGRPLRVNRARSRVS